MDEDSIPSGWELFKVIEEDEKGELHLLQDSFDGLLKHKIQEHGGAPIIFTAFLGPSSSGKQLFTSLFSTYAECNGQCWSSQIKKNGLKQFALSSTAESSSQSGNKTPEPIAEEKPMLDLKKTGGDHEMATKSTESSKENPLTELHDITDKILEAQFIPVENGQKEAFKELVKAAQNFKKELGPLKILKDTSETMEVSKGHQNVGENIEGSTMESSEVDIGALANEYVVINIGKNNFGNEFLNCCKDLNLADVIKPTSEPGSLNLDIIGDGEKPSTLATLKMDDSIGHLSRVPNNPKLDTKDAEADEITTNEHSVTLRANHSENLPTVCSTIEQLKEDGETFDGKHGPHENEKETKQEDNYVDEIAISNPSTVTDNISPEILQLENRPAACPEEETPTSTINEKRKDMVEAEMKSVSEKVIKSLHEDQKVKTDGSDTSLIPNDQTPPNVHTQTRLCSNENKSGIYLWPQLYQLDCSGTKRLLWVVYVDEKPGSKFEASNFLNMLVAIMCSRLADIRPQGMSVYESIQKLTTLQKFTSLKTDLCNAEDVHTICGDQKLEKNSFPTNEYYLSDDIITASIQIDFTNMILKGKNFRAFQSLAQSLIDETDLKSKMLDDGETVLNLTNTKAYLQQIINKINVCNGFEAKMIPDPPQKPEKAPARSHLMQRRKSPSPRLSQKRLSLSPQLDKRLDVEPHKFNDPSISARQKNISRYSLPNNLLAKSKPKLYAKKQHKLVDMHPNQETPKALTLSRVTDPETREHVSDHAIQVTLDRNMAFLFDLLKQWINSNLNFENGSEIQMVFDHWHKLCLKNKLTLPNSYQDALAAEKSLSQKMGEIGQSKITQIQNGIGRFQSEIKSIFAPSKYISQENLNQYMQMALQNTMQNLGPSEVVLLIEHACRKLMPGYVEHNKYLIQIEKEISRDAIPTIINFHMEYLKNILSHTQIFPLSDISIIHNKITMEMVSLYKGIFFDETIFTEDIQDLETQFTENFDKFCTKYISKLDAAERKIKRLVVIQKDEYNTQMDTLFASNPSGIRKNLLERKHEQLLTKLKENLEYEIKEEICPVEPMNKHLTALETYIDEKYTYLAEENTITLEKHDGKSQDIVPISYDTHDEDDLTSINTQNGIIVSQKPNQRPGSFAAPEIRLRSNTAENPLATIGKYKLPPIIFQIALNNIGVSLAIEGNDYGTSLHTARIGLSVNGEWVCGNKVSQMEASHPNYFTRVWDFTEILTIQNWQDSLQLDNNLFSITAEFLLAIFLRFLVETVEAETKGEVTSALVSVPFWFASFQREVISQGTYLAGLEQVSLVNENSAAAFHAYVSDTVKHKCEMVVISENSHKVDVSIYSYDSSLKKVALLGHAGDYESEISPNNGYGILKAITSVFSYLWSQPQNEGVVNTALQRLNDVWLHALKTVQNNHPGSTNIPMSVLVCCESEACSMLLWKLARSIAVNEQYIIHSNQSPVIGMSCLYNVMNTYAQESVLNLIKDGMAFHITARTPDGDHQVVFKKLESFAVSGKRLYHCQLPYMCGQFNLYQTNTQQQGVIGILNIISLPSSGNGFVVTLDRDHDGILKLIKIEYTKKYSLRGGKEGVTPRHYDWQPFHLPCTTIDRYKQVLAQIYLFESVANNIEEDIKEVSEIGEKIRQTVYGGRVAFSSTLVKEMLLGQIDDVLRSIKRPNVQTEEINEQKNNLMGIALKYRIQIN